MPYFGCATVAPARTRLPSFAALEGIEVTAGGGAIRVKINGAGKFLSLALDPEFLKEDAKLVADTVLAAVQDAAKQAKDYNDAEMQKVTSALKVPGLF